MYSVYFNKESMSDTRRKAPALHERNLPSTLVRLWWILRFDIRYLSAFGGFIIVFLIDFAVAI